MGQHVGAPWAITDTQGGPLWGFRWGHLCGLVASLASLRPNPTLGPSQLEHKWTLASLPTASFFPHTTCALDGDLVPPQLASLGCTLAAEPACALGLRSVLRLGAGAEETPTVITSAWVPGPSRVLGRCVRGYFITM